MVWLTQQYRDGKTQFQKDEGFGHVGGHPKEHSGVLGRGEGQVGFHVATGGNTGKEHRDDSRQMSEFGQTKGYVENGEIQTEFQEWCGPHIDFLEEFGVE